MNKTELLKFFDACDESDIWLYPYCEKDNLSDMKYFGFAKRRGTGEIYFDDGLNHLNADYAYGVNCNGNLYFIDRDHKPYRGIMLRRTMFLPVSAEQYPDFNKDKAYVFRHIDNDDFTSRCYIRPELLNTFREEQIWEERKFVYHYYYLPKEFR